MALAYEFIDRRALAALQFVDVTGRPVSSPVAVTAEGATFIAKGGGRVAVMTAPGLDAHSAAFERPPTTPALGNVTLQLDIRPSDKGLGARRFALRLPRTAALAQQGAPASLFTPVEIELLPTPRAQRSGLVAALSVTVRRSDDERRIEGAVVRLRTAGGRPPARAVTDVAGDALLLIPGVPLSSPGPNATVLPDLAGQLDVFVDPALARFTADADLADARVTPRPGPPIDPDDVLDRITPSPAATARVASGQVRTAAIAWSP